MHVLHRIAVEAENAEEAKQIVIEYIEDDNFDWSDWSIVGGRWGEEDTVISYSDTPEKFLEAVETAKQWRVEQVNSYLSGVDVDHVMGLLKNYNGEQIAFNEQEGMQVWRLNQALEIASGNSNPYSYFYDIVDGGTDGKYLKERIEKSFTEQYLVAVDFHF
jgi:hypothetical protein